MARIDPKYLINLKESDLDKPIYRYISIDRLLQYLQTNQNVLVKPFKWKDPFENYISKLVINHNEYNENPVYLMGFKHTFFAQCWTLKKECDLMWKSNIPNCIGVQLKTTIRKLINSISKQTISQIKFKTGKTPKVFVGKVKYIPKTKLLDVGFIDWEKIAKTKPDKEEVLKTLFVKRKEFSNEKEVRIVLNTNIVYNIKDINDLMQIPYICSNDTNGFKELIDQIVIDPRVNENLFLCYNKRLWI